MRSSFWVLVILFPMVFLANGATAASNAKKNEKLVKDFYEEVFVKHHAKEAAEKYLSKNYIQHNPFVATGRKPFIDFFVPFFQKNPTAKATIKRVIASKNLVVLHVHSQASPGDRGRAVVDIFRVKKGKIVEHWDVAQPIPEKMPHSNTMF